MPSMVLMNFLASCAVGHGGQDSALGILLLAMYLTCDSFTSQWQDKVYKKHQVCGLLKHLGDANCLPDNREHWALCEHVTSRMR